MNMNNTPALLALALAAGCSGGTVEGELDGLTVPSFGHANFGLATSDRFTPNGGQLRGLAMPGDSCSDGAEFLLTGRNIREARQVGDVQARVAFINERLPLDSWFFSVLLGASDVAVLEDVAVDLAAPADGPLVEILLCQHIEPASFDDEGPRSGIRCLVPTDGTVVVRLTEGELRITSTDDHEFKLAATPVGRARIDMTFRACDQMQAEMAACIDSEFGCFFL